MKRGANSPDSALRKDHRRLLAQWNGNRLPEAEQEWAVVRHEFFSAYLALRKIFELAILERKKHPQLAEQLLKFCQQGGVVEGVDGPPDRVDRKMRALSSYKRSLRWEGKGNAFSRLTDGTFSK